MGKIILCAMVSRDGFMQSRDGRELPWCLPSRAARLRTYATGEVVVSDSSTFDTLEKDGGLPDCARIAVGTPRPGARFALTLEGAIRLARRCYPERDVYIVGGKYIVTEGLRRADELDLTHVKAELREGVRFPLFPLPSSWTNTGGMQLLEHPVEDDHPLAFIRYQRAPITP